MNINYIQIINGAILFLIIALLFVLYFKKNKNIEISQELVAPSWERTVAFIIDMLICSVFSYIVVLFIGKFSHDTSNLIKNSIFIIICWTYFVCLESSNLQATIGKIHEGIIVVNTDGTKVSFIKANIRLILLFISNITFFIGLFMIVFSKYKQGFHDKLTDTLVIKKNYSSEKLSS